MSAQEESPEVPVAAVAAEVVSDTDGTVEVESDSPVLMDGWCEKKGRFGFFHPRHYTLAADGKVLAAKDDTSTEKKHMFDLKEDTTFEPTRETHLVIKGHNDRKDIPVEITLRFKESEDRDKWVEAFEKYFQKEEEEESDSTEIGPMQEVGRTCDENMEQLCRIS